MKALTFICLTVLFAFAVCGKAAEPVVFDFSDKQEFEAVWKIRRSALHIPASKFKVEKCSGARDGKALVVECNNSSGIALISPPGLDFKKTPIMRWRWRVIRPVKFTGTQEPDDQAAAIYICDGNTIRQFTISYRWEIMRRPGSCLLKRYGGGAVTVFGICMRNRATRAGEWVVEERNVLEDFRNCFKRDIRKRFAIGVAGNSQYTKSNTRVEIDYIEFLPEKKGK
ncbi:MAG: DUF3047 domain-containing protein [Lentisphaerae bacterium]|nr:DUF3047 domain-containing protein [Lentisphaerota bacterium]